MNRNESRPERDEQLGGALRGLPVPDHQPRFWADLAQRLTSEPTRLAPAAGIPPKEKENVIPLDEHQPRRRRLNLPASAAAALVVVLVAGGLLWARSGDRPRRVEVAGRPATGQAAPIVFSATYDYNPTGIGTGAGAGPGGATGGATGTETYRLTVAHDGSFRWTSQNGDNDTAYDAAAGRAVWVVQDPAVGTPFGEVVTSVSPGGPDRGLPLPEPLSSLADFVTALGRSDDRRAEETSAFGRPAWRYDGPLVPDQLGDGSPDHAVAEVDQATGVLLNLRETSAGQPVFSLVATSVETSDTLDRSRFRFEVPPGVKPTTTDRGFRAVSLDQAGDLAGYEPLVPGQVPDGFRLESVAVDRDVPSVTGAEGLNPPATHVVTLRYANGFLAFTVTQRPKGNPEYPWEDPFGQEGMGFRSEPVNLRLPGGRAPLEGSLVIDPPSVPHLWGITGDRVVTVDGDLGAAQLHQVAGSLQAHR